MTTPLPSSLIKQRDEQTNNSSEPTQADIAAYEALKGPVDSAKYPYAASYQERIDPLVGKDLPGDKSKAAEILKFDDDVDLFADEDEEDPEAERIKAERVKAYNEKKAAKGPATPSKSVVTFDVKPWDDETDMKGLEESVRSIQMDGLLWGASKLVPIGYGVNKLQITIVVEDDKVSMDDLQERVQELEDYVQSSDIAAMQKL